MHRQRPTESIVPRTQSSYFVVTTIGAPAALLGDRRDLGAVVLEGLLVLGLRFVRRRSEDGA